MSEEGIQIRQMFYTDPEHPKDPCMVQLHVWTATRQTCMGPAVRCQTNMTPGEETDREDKLDAMCHSLVKLIRLQAEGAALKTYRRLNGITTPESDAMMAASQRELDNTIFATLRRFLREQS